MAMTQVRERAGSAVDEVGRHRYIRLTTFRASGEAVVTPVLCVVDGERLVVHTRSSSGKAKRIRRDPSVRVGGSTARGKARGPEIAGRATMVERERRGRIDRLFAEKYGLGWWLTDTIGRGRQPDSVFVEIELGS
jgi:PPOX class probable F420-dependent enzyme